MENEGVSFQDQNQTSAWQRQALVKLFQELTQLMTPDGIQASAWELYQGAIFGRDSERVALDLLPWMDSLSQNIIFSLLRLQGSQDNPLTEEEPGRIHHEYRHLFVGGRKVGAEQQLLLKELSERWGGTDREMIYYGAVDATPQLVRLIASYCHCYGPSILDVEFMHRRGTVRTVRQGLLDALEWIEQRIRNSDIGLLEFQRRNPRGLRWQAMRDGSVAYLHEDGQLANANAPIASLEVQGLAFDALLYGAELFQPELPEKAADWQELACQLQETTLSRFWLDSQHFFAMAIDRDGSGRPRPLTTLSSVAAELLETRIFDSLAEDDTARYVSAIVHEMYGPEFLTDVGIRSRALRHHELVPLWDYQGSKVSWVVTSNVFALGLRRQGFLELAEDMENRLLNGYRIAKEALEYYYVDELGTVHYRHHEERDPERHPVIIGTNRPESVQAWTVSALLGILLRREEGGVEALPALTPSYWQRKTELEVLSSAPRSTLSEDLSSGQTQPSPQGYYVDRSEGQRLERSILEKSGYLD